MTDVARRVPTEVPVGAGAELLPGRPVDLGAALKVGVYGGVIAAFVSAIGMVDRFQQNRIVGDLTFGYLILLAIGIGFGYLAARPPQHLEGFAETEPGPRNVLAGFLAGLPMAAVMVGFVALFGNLDLRQIFTNASPQVIGLVTFQRGLVVGSALIAVAGVGAATLGGALHLVPVRWRRPLFAAVGWIVVFGLVTSLVGQVLRGLKIGALTRFLYLPSGALKPSGAIGVGVFFYLLYSLLALYRPRIRSGLQRAGVVPDEFGRRSQTRKVAVLAALAILVAVLGALPQVLGTFLSEVFNIAGIFLVMALGLNIVVGYAGLLDLGYVAFFAVGAYTTAVLTSPISPRFAPDLSFWEALPFVVVAAAIAGLVVGTPVLRMRGDYLAIVTLGFGEIARLLLLSDWLKPTFNGAQGIYQIPNIQVGPVDIRGPQLFFYAIFAFVLLAAYASWALQASRVGRAWMAMREDESVAEAMGINIVSAKLSAFIIGAILASFAGALFATKIGSVFPHSFVVITSITVLVVIIVGGIASVPGVVVGALVLIALPELLREFAEFRFLIYGGLLIFMMLKRPEGFIPSKRRARELHEEEALQDSWLQAQAREQEEARTAEAR